MRKAKFGALVVLGCGLLTAQAAPEAPEATKKGKIYHIGGDVKPPRAITSPQPVSDENGKNI
jgi:hypothetical protein